MKYDEQLHPIANSGGEAQNDHGDLLRRIEDLERRIRNLTIEQGATMRANVIHEAVIMSFLIESGATNLDKLLNRIEQLQIAMSRTPGVQGGHGSFGSIECSTKLSAVRTILQEKFATAKVRKDAARGWKPTVVGGSCSEDDPS